QNLFDSILNVYAKTKPKKAESKKFEDIKRYDIFAGLNEQDFIDRIINYYAEINLRKSAYSAWISRFNLQNTGIENENWHKKIAETLLKSNDIRLSEIIYIRHLELYPKQKEIIKSLSDFTVANNKNVVA